MKQILENLWNEYLWDQCAAIDTDEERKLTKLSAELHEKATASLNEEQKENVQKYIETLCHLDSLFVKKAFFKGCEFSVSFLLENIIS